MSLDEETNVEQHHENVSWRECRDGWRIQSVSVVSDKTRLKIDAFEFIQHTKQLAKGEKNLNQPFPKKLTKRKKDVCNQKIQKFTNNDGL